MKATESPLVNLLKGPRQFLIPIYQRNYSWTEEQCAQLWDDVLRVAQDDRYPGHFIGSVVYIAHGLYQATTIPQLLVIDGQQRLTTFTLMIEAVARALGEGGGGSGDINDRKLRSYFLFNTEEDGSLRYKLQLSAADTPTLRAIVDRKDLPKNPSRRLADNFELFQDWLEESSVAPEVVYRGLAKLMVVDVALDREHDNPQLIFESLNSTGLDLSQSDLIRNFVLMGLEPALQEELYRDHWRPIEEILSRADRTDVFDRFLRAWLTLRLGEVPKLDNGYEAFKRYRGSKRDLSIADLLADLHRRADAYACIALGQEEHPGLASVFSGLQALRIDAPMPFLLHAYALWKEGRVGDEDIVLIAQLLESWLFRRAVCDIPSNVLSRTFATLPGQLDEDALRESFEAYLALRTGRQRFPKDEEFSAALKSRNLYDFKHLQYCLTRQENDGRKERVNVGDYTVEHVLPQNESLSPEWRAMLGPDWQGVQERWLHTLGNLTLTGYNPELSDRPFLTKRDAAGGFANSPLRLNRDLAKLTSWDEKAIQERAARLADNACAIWTAPQISAEILAKYRDEPKAKRRSLPLSDVEHLDMTDATRRLYEAFLDGAEDLGLVPTIWQRFVGIGKPGRGKPYPVIVSPRKGWLLLRLLVPFGDLVDPPGCAYAHEERLGFATTRAKVRTLDEVRECLAILPRAAGVAGLDLDDGLEDEDEGA